MDEQGFDRGEDAAVFDKFHVPRDSPECFRYYQVNQAKDEKNDSYPEKDVFIILEYAFRQRQVVEKVEDDKGLDIDQELGNDNEGGHRGGNAGDEGDSQKQDKRNIDWCPFQETSLCYPRESEEYEEKQGNGFIDILDDIVNEGNMLNVFR